MTRNAVKLLNYQKDIMIIDLTLCVCFIIKQKLVGLAYWMYSFSLWLFLRSVTWVFGLSYTAVQCNPRITINKILYISNKLVLFWEKYKSSHCDWSIESSSIEKSTQKSSFCPRLLYKHKWLHYGNNKRFFCIKFHCVCI